MKLLLKYILLLHCSLLIAQVPVKFNYSYTMNNCSSQSQCVYRYDNKYLVFGFATNTLTGQQQGLNLLVTDTFGIELQEKQFYHPDNYLFYANAIRPFDLINDRYVLFSGILNLAFNHHIGVLAKINLQTLDTMWVKSYNQPGDSCELFTSTYLADSSMLVVGERYFIQNNFRSSKPFIMKIDKYGNYIWHKYLYNTWNSYSIIPNRILKLDENNFIIGGMKRAPNSNDGFILRVDTNGNRAFDVGTLGFSKSWLEEVIKLNDESFLGVGGYYTFNNFQQKLVYQFSGVTGTKIKAKGLNIQAKVNGGKCAFQNTNGIIYIGGGTGLPDGSYNYNADILLLNSNLDSIATVLYPMPTNSGLFPNSIISTKDGGFITTLFHLPNSGIAKNWLIKADSTGCFEVNCPINNGIEEVEKENGELMVWPNPADDMLVCSVTSNYDKSTEVLLFDELGRSIRSFSVEFDKNKITLDLSSVPSGFYTMRVQSGRKFMNKKIAVSHIN